MLIRPHSPTHENVGHHPMEGEVAMLENIVEGLHMTIVNVEVGIC